MTRSAAWSLSHIDVENFKSINSARVDVNPGFTVIAGPNGSGKSCLLESIGFGLGASSAELRVHHLGELCGNDCPGQRVRVALKFTNGKACITIGCSLVDGNRLYLVGNTKVTKIKFSQVLTETLGFSKDSISWNISQRAVQDIIKASPKKLFDTLSFVAGTHSVLEARDIAIKQVEQSEQQLIAVTNVIKKLEEDIETETKTIQLVNKMKEVQEALRDAQEMKKLVEKTYEAAKKYVSLLTATELAIDLESDYKKEQILKMSMKSEGEISEQKNDEKRKHKRVVVDSEDIVDEPPPLIEQCRTACATANDSVTKTQLKITKQKRISLQTEKELQELESAKKKAETELAARENEAVEDEREYSLLTEEAIPQLQIRISALQLQTESEDFRTSTTDSKAVVEHKAKQHRRAVEVVKHSESLLMAVCAAASQQQSVETDIRNKLKRVQIERDAIELKAKMGEQIVLERGAEFQENNQEYRSRQQQQCKLIGEKEHSLQQQIQSLRKALHLPPSHYDTGNDRSNGSGKVSTNEGTESDAIFLADLVQFSVEDQGSVRDDSVNEGNRFMTALDTIIGSKFSVRICRDGKEAESIMKRIHDDRNSNQSQGMRIWPMNRLTASTKRSSGYLDVLKAFPEKTVDPISLLHILPGEWDVVREEGEGGRQEREYCPVEKGQEGAKRASADAGDDPMLLRKVLFKAVENWIIVDSDETASQIISNKILSRNISGCVTLAGNKHTLGSLSVGKTNNAGGRENYIPQLQLEFQVRYQKLKLKYQTVNNELQLLLTKIRNDERYTEQKELMKEYSMQLLLFESGIADISESFASQSKIAEQAHRELVAARAKLEEAESYRDRLKFELLELNDSNDNDKLLTSKRQEGNRLKELIEKRNSFEKKTSILSVTVIEKKEEITRLQEVIMSTEIDILSLVGRITTEKKDTIILENSLVMYKSTANVENEKLVNCIQLQIANERKKAILIDEMETVRDTIKVKKQHFLQNFINHGQHSFNKIYSKRLNNVSKPNEKSERSRKLVRYDESDEEENQNTATDWMKEMKLVEEIESYKLTAKNELEEIVSLRLLQCIESEPERYIKETRFTVVEAREKVAVLQTKVQQVQLALVEAAPGLGNDEVVSQKHISNRKGHSDSDDEKEDSSDTDSDDMTGKRRKQKKGGEQKMLGADKRQEKLKISREQDMRENLHRKSSQLAAVQGKYDQIKLSISALTAGTDCVDDAIAELHSSTYRALRKRCQRYFSDLVPGKRIDLIPISPDLELSKGLKFVLLSDRIGGVGGESDDEDYGESQDEDGDEGTAGKMEKENGQKNKGKGKGKTEKNNEDDSYGRESNRKEKRSISELSGGQLSLLGLSFVFAAALHKRNPLYLLDEVDAALDESNQKIVGAVIAKIFMKSQVACVSHHTNFQEQAMTFIPVAMKDGHSVIKSG